MDEILLTILKIRTIKSGLGRLARAPDEDILNTEQQLPEEYTQFFNTQNIGESSDNALFSNLEFGSEQYKNTIRLLRSLESRLVNSINTSSQNGQIPLNLSAKDLSDVELQIISEAISNPNCRLTSIDLSRNHITHEGVRFLSEALQDPNCKLTNINLSRNNDIENIAAGYLSEALEDPNCKLEYLDISNNNIEDEGVRDIAAALKNPNCNLSYLDFTENNATEVGLRSLARVLRHQDCKLVRLDLGNISSNRILNEIESALEENKNIIHGEFYRRINLKQIAERNLHSANNVVGALNEEFSKEKPNPSSQLLSEFLPRIWAVKHIFSEIENGKETFEKIEKFCLKKYENYIDRAANKNASIGRIITNQSNNLESSSPTKGGLVLLPSIVEVAIEEQKHKEELDKKTFLNAFHQGKCPRNKKEWENISINVLEEVIKEFLDPTTTSVDQNTIFKTREEKVKFLEGSTIKEHKDYETLLKRLIESRPNTIISRQTAKKEQTKEKEGENSIEI